MKKLLFTIALLIPVGAWGKQCQSDYPPAKLAQGTIPNIHPGLVFVEPPYAGFDPCNSTVEIKVNEKSEEELFIKVEADDRVILMKKPQEEVIGTTEDHYWRNRYNEHLSC